MAIDITESNFNDIIANNPVVVIDFWAQWCGPCKSLSPIIDDLANEYEGKITVGKVDIDQNQSLCDQFEIMSIPTILAFKNGQLIDRHVGLCGKDELKKIFDQLI